MKSSRDLDGITITAPAFTMHAAPHWVAFDKGFFMEEGLNVDIEYKLAQPRKWVGEELCGEIVFEAPGGSAPFVAAREGRETINVVSVQDKAGHVFVARPEIKSIADLKGKRIIAGTSGASYVDACYTLRHFGLDPDKDIKEWVPSADKPPDTERARIDSLANGEIDAVCSGPPHWYMAVKMGFHRLPSARDIASWAMGGLATTRKVITERPDVVKRVVRALIKGSEFARMNKEETLSIISRHTIYVDRDTLSGCYDEIHNDWYVTADEELYRKTIDIYSREYKLSPRPIEAYYELRFVREALEELRLSRARLK